MRNPNKLTVLTTSTCTARCSHCGVNSGPERRDRLTFEKIKEVVDQLHKRVPLQVVVFAGGEPTLLKERLFDSIAYCDSLGIPTRVVTNASWATTRYSAQKMIRRFREAGLAEINFSADDQHLPFISFDNIKRAWEASKNQGFLNVAIANCTGPNSEITPEYIMRELNEPDLILRFDDDGIEGRTVRDHDDGSTYLLSNARLQRVGRAAETILDADLTFPASQDELNMPCPWAITFGALSPRGHLVACCGMEAEGNEVLDFGPVNESIEDNVIKANADPVMQAIAKFGPYSVMKFSKSKDPSLNFREQYASVCEVCEHMVSQPQVISLIRNSSDEFFSWANEQKPRSKKSRRV